MSENCNHQAITEIVERIVASGALGSGERQVALLRYLVGEELAGRGDHIKAYSIGTDVLGRSTSFDPSQDAIVRVEIGRLRKTLTLYFATQGRAFEQAIIIDKGTYRPRFVKNERSLLESATTKSGRLISSAAAAGRATLIKRRPLAILASLLLVIALTGAGWLYIRNPSESPADAQHPLLLVQIPDIAGLTTQSGGQRLVLQHAFLQQLLSRDWLTVRLMENEASGTLETRVRPVFHLHANLSNVNENNQLTAVLERMPDRDVVWTGRLEGQPNPMSANASARSLAESLFNDLTDMSGPLIESIARRSTLTSALADTPYRCMLNARRYLRHNAVKQFHDSKICLTRLVEQDPSMNKLRAMLVYLLMEEATYPHLSPLPLTINTRQINSAPERREALLQQAKTLLDQGDPKDRTLLAANMTLSACLNQPEQIRPALNTLRDLQTNMADAHIALGLLAGPALDDWSMAISAEARAFALNAHPLPWYQFISAIKAAMDEDSAQALRLLSRVPMHDNAIGNAMILAFGAEAGAYLRVANASATLTRLGYGDKAALITLVDSSCYSEAVKTRIRRGITTAAIIASKS